MRLSCRGCYLAALACCVLSWFVPASAWSKDAGAVEQQTGHLAEAKELSTAHISGGFDSDLRRRLWSALIGAPKVQEDQSGKRDLERLIEQIRSIEFRPQEEVAEPVSGAADVKVEPNGMQPASERPEKQQEQEATIESGCRAVSSRTLSRIKELAKQPAQVENPCELAEVLYLSGAMKEAAVFYEEALNRKGVGETVSPQQRAWIMFQAGNCLRHLDMPKAQKFYRRLIADYPDSCWVDLAKAQDKLIEWYLSEKPETLTVEDASKQKPEIVAGQGAGA